MGLRYLRKSERQGSDEAEVEGARVGAQARAGEGRLARSAMAKGGGFVGAEVGRHTAARRFALRGFGFGSGLVCGAAVAGAQRNDGRCARAGGLQCRLAACQCAPQQRHEPQHQPGAGAVICSALGAQTMVHNKKRAVPTAIVKYCE
jgi:hypothetical protein